MVSTPPACCPAPRSRAALFLAAWLPLAAAAAGEAGQPPAGAWVKLRDARVVQVEVARGGHTAEQRATSASAALADALAKDPAATARVEPAAGGALVRVGQVPVLEVGPEDAAAAGAASPEVQAAAVAARVDRALQAERARLAVQAVVFSVSLLVFAGLVAFLLLRRLARLEAQLALALSARSRARALSVAGVQVATEAETRGALRLALRGGWLLAQVLIVWLWALLGLSLFPGTRPWADRLARGVVDPVVDLAGRAGQALPAILAAAALALTVAVALRILRALLAGAARGEADLRGVRADRARALSGIASAALVLGALVFAAPLLGGGGVVARIGETVLLAVGLGATPVLACAIAGLPLVLGREVHVGDRVEVGGREGKVVGFGPLALAMEDDAGARVQVPYLLALVRPLRILPGRARPGERDAP
ncbi:MAG TPA: mechanosensitive ion channel family protein [Anaeromyxobacter sp.]|nr:mechanosensitive ion channel family protein [Anaeromyxobacter sp.]